MNHSDKTKCGPGGAGEINIELDADKAKLLLDDQALDRIIAAVGKTLTKPDRDVLRRDLLICYGQYSIASGPGQSGFVRRQKSRLNSIQKHAKKLVDLLKADDADVRIIRKLWPISPERPAHLLPQMVFFVETIDKMTGMHGKPGDIAERTNARLGKSGSALQWLTNALLTAIYSKHFAREAGISRNLDGSLGGPYIRFARQVLAELKIECSDETIASALRMVKS
jgi:hypothetical protein